MGMHRILGSWGVALAVLTGLVVGCQTVPRPVTVAEPAALPIVQNVEPQPLMASALRLSTALSYLGSALSDEDQERLEALSQEPHSPQMSLEIQRILDPYCLAGVNINPEARVKVERGPADAVLMQDGWRSFLVKVHNESGTRAELAWESPNAEPILHISSGRPEPLPRHYISPGDLDNRFLELKLYEEAPMGPRLSGLTLEYKILQVYTRDTGQREASIGFNVGQGTRDIGYRNMFHVLFDCEPSVKVVLDVKDHDGSPVMASFIFRDNVQRLTADPTGKAMPTDYRNQRALRSAWQRHGVDAKPLVGVYPLPSRRVADRDEFPDFFFQPQIYRQDGEHIYLPPGTYDVTVMRGPEYHVQQHTITVPANVRRHRERFELERWIHLASKGWYSGDHHIHAGGCSHYESPEAGVKPEAMLRQIQGEDLNIGCVLSWGPCWYYQKSFFDGDVHPLSTEENLIRYDVEVSGFPSSHAGHLCLLRLREDDYPGTTRIEEWPSYTLPVLQWGQQQGGVVGYSHSGWGLEPETPTEDLPNYVMANFDGIGANEYIMTVTHDAVDFISAGDTPLPWEMNIWYHTLNAGYRIAISGETDYPCIFDERVGMARSYVKMDGPLDFDKFAQKLKEGGAYVSDGMSHILDFRVNDVEMGIDGSELRLPGAQTVEVTATVAAMLPEEQDEAGKMIADGGLEGRPYWHIEKARIPGTRRVPVELLVNGYPVQTVEVEADGSHQEVRFDLPVEHSSWIALRILATAHTNPIYTLVADQPIRASRRSAEWCRAAVDKCWEMKHPLIRRRELAAAEAAYDHARAAFDRIIAESIDDRE